MNVDPHETEKILSLAGATEKTRPWQLTIEAERASYNWLRSPQDFKDLGPVFHFPQSSPAPGGPVPEPLLLCYWLRIDPAGVQLAN